MFVIIAMASVTSEIKKYISGDEKGACDSL